MQDMLDRWRNGGPAFQNRAEGGSKNRITSFDGMKHNSVDGFGRDWIACISRRLPGPFERVVSYGNECRFTYHVIRRCDVGRAALLNGRCWQESGEICPKRRLRSGKGHDLGSNGEGKWGGRWFRSRHYHAVGIHFASFCIGKGL